MSRRKPIRLLIALVILVAAAGCGGSGPALVPVSGSVTMNDRPVETGEIIFRAADGSVASGAAPIKDGRYEARVPAGVKRVEIIATRRSGPQGAKPRGSGESPPSEMYVPERYNAKSELTADVKASGLNAFDFALEDAASGK